MTNCSLKTNIPIKFPLAVKEKTAISLEIENAFNEIKELTYIEILVKWAEDNDLEPCEVSQCINDVLKQKILNEATSLNMMKTRAKSSVTLDFLM